MSQFGMILTAVVLVAIALVGAGYWLWKKYFGGLLQREKEVEIAKQELLQWMIIDETARSLVTSVEALNGSLQNVSEILKKADLTRLDVTRCNSLSVVLEQIKFQSAQLSQSFDQRLNAAIKQGKAGYNQPSSTGSSSTQPTTENNNKPKFGGNNGNGSSKDSANNKFFGDTARTIGSNFNELLSIFRKLNTGFTVDMFCDLSKDEQDKLLEIARDAMKLKINR